MKLKDSYHLLSKDERLSLFLQAASRGDTLEAQAIIEASPYVELKMVDFSVDVRALILATLLHCLGQVNLLTAITHLWEDRDNDLSFLCARLYASQYVVREEAFRSICKQDGFDYDRLLATLGNFLYVNSNSSLFDWVKKLALTKTEYQTNPHEFVVLELPTLEDQLEEHRKTIALFRRQFG